ncbi:MAG: CRTAC1 family protein [Solirubrobacterales bacterium]
MLQLLSRMAALALVIVLAGGSPPARAASWEPIDTTGFAARKLFDLGVADWNGDGRLDVFTTNHKFPSSLLSGDGAGGLIERGAAVGLGPTPAFPGFDDLFRAPDRTEPGLYIFASHRDEPGEPLRIRTSGASASGELTFAAKRITVERAEGATATTGTSATGLPILEFDAGPGAAIDVVADHLDLPIEVAVDPPIAPGSIRVGADAVPAADREFELSLRDRHGFGFADFDGDRSTDIFVSSGGLGGEISDPYFTSRQTDELLLATGSGGFAEAVDRSGLAKGDCRGRGVQVADLGGDGGLDILQACEGRGPLVHLGDGHGGFTTTAGPPGPADAYRALDLVGDRRPEIVAAATGAVTVWRAGPGGWRAAQRLQLTGGGPIGALASADYDGDGDRDLFVAGIGANTILRNDGGRLRPRDPRRIGLPGGGSAAAGWVDYDNDGDLDLDLVPQGLMKYDGDRNRYQRTGRLRYPPPPEGRIGVATVSWPDLNGDGRREPLTSRARGEFAPEQVLDARLSVPPANLRRSHWLEVDLVGSRSNREAVGAEVRAVARHRRFARWVGESEGSHESSGHYRLYWGLGRIERLRRLVVIWPDGSRTVRRDVRVDRLLTIER